MQSRRSHLPRILTLAPVKMNRTIMKITVISLQSHYQRRKSKARYGISIERFMLERKTLFRELLTLPVPIPEEEILFKFLFSHFFVLIQKVL